MAKTYLQIPNVTVDDHIADGDIQKWLEPLSCMMQTETRLIIDTLTSGGSAMAGSQDCVLLC